MLADENVDGSVVDALRRDGHEVAYVAEFAPGIADDEVLQRANALGALLVTADKDFGEMVFRQGLVHSGVILLRLAGLAPDEKAATPSSALRSREAQLRDAFCVVSPSAIRIRRKS